MLDHIDKGMRKLAAALAILGGLALIAVMLSTVASVTGRALIPLGLSPIRGDFELVELGTGFAVFAFLPWVQINRQHASVEILTMHLSARTNRLIDLVADILMAMIALLLAWKHWQGTLDKLAYGETTFIIQYPVWWAYASGLVGAIGFVIVSLWCVLLSFRALLSGRDQAHGEVVH
ncbi:TRAP transporter small permease [Hoeflea sp.]|uniref:TRAP transporter small permease n=1 Tax=Hoeflea sp. TaxID=1940281 RepID=UPI003B52EBDD